MASVAVRRPFRRVNSCATSALHGRPSGWPSVIEANTPYETVVGQHRLALQQHAIGKPQRSVLGQTQLLATPALRLHGGHTVAERCGSQAVGQYHALIAASRLARHGPDERLAGRERRVVVQQPAGLPEVGVGGAVAGIEKAGQLAEVSVFLVVELLVHLAPPARR